MSIGNKIKIIRKEKNMSQQELADYLNISRQAISRWENDVALPDIITLISIAKFFEISLDYFADEKQVELEKKTDIKKKINHKEVIKRSTRYIVVVSIILTLVAILPSKVKIPIIFYSIIFIIFLITCLLIYFIIKNYLTEKS